MSAFIVDKVHVDAMLTAGLEWSEEYGVGAWRLGDSVQRLTANTTERVGRMLLEENGRSVGHRYAERQMDVTYEFQRLGRAVDPCVVLHAIACYEYQSCEHPDWESSEARAFCEALRLVAISQLPAYQRCEVWEITDRNIFGPA